MRLVKPSGTWWSIPLEEQIFLRFVSRVHHNSEQWNALCDRLIQLPWANALGAPGRI